MKKIFLLGTGAQGSTVAQRMDEEPNVSEIICADYDMDAVNELVGMLKKGRGVQVDANDKDSIVAAAKGCDLLVNALPLKFGPIVLEAALELKCNYQDFAATDVIVPDYVEGIKIMYKDYGDRFKAIGKTAIIGTGSAPGLICVVARNAMRYLDSCQSIYCNVYEGVEAKRFMPFWWSPVTALGDMTDQSYAYINGELVETEPHSLPIKRIFKGIDKEVTLVEHAHDEPVYLGLNAEEYFKGCQNAYFKYGGIGVDFSTPLYRAGLLSKEKEMINGQEVVPFEVILAHIPAAPKFAHEIKEILDEGLVSDTGAFVVEAYGKKDGKDVLVETYVSAPGCVESFERSGLTGEMYLTGQGGSLFTKMFVNDKLNRPGLMSSDMLTFEEVDYYLDCAKELDIVADVEVREAIEPK